MQQMIIRTLAGALGIGLTILIVFASLENPIGDSFKRITQDLWGWVTLADLYLGFILIAIVIGLFETSRRAAFFWILPLFFLGNVWSALWLVVRLPHLLAQLRK